MRVLIIGNPISGGGRTARSIGRLADALRGRGHEVESFLTARAGDGRERASRVGDDCDRLVVVGGDGTLNEVLNGLADPGAIPLAQLATGTANILAHELEFPRNPETAARMIERGRVRWIDMGRVNARRFLMVVSAGFDAEVTRHVRERRSGTQGYAAYARPILGALAGYRPPSLTASVDDAQPVTGGLVIVSNTRNYGGMFALADRARCDSGHLDILVLRDAALIDLARVATAGLTGRGLSRMPGVTYMTGRRFKLTSTHPVPVQVDGDYFGTTPIEIDLDPAAVPVVVPA